MMNGIFADEKIRLRAVEADDITHFIRWENDTDLWSFGGQIQPLSKYAISQYLEQSLCNDVFSMHQVRLIIEFNNSVAGSIDLFDVDPLTMKASVGLVIDKKYRGNGFGEESLRKLIAYSFEMLNLHQLYAHVPVSNQASVALFTKAGFKNVARLKDWTRRNGIYEDVFFFQLIRDNKAAI